jgi:2-keto-3-deoxy-L-rhamnonate aldolase RhmA
MGYRGRQDVADVQAAIECVRSAAVRHGKVVGRPAATTEQVESGMEQGFRFFQLNSDLNLLELGAKRVLEPLGRGPAASPRALY